MLRDAIPSLQMNPNERSGVHRAVECQEVASWPKALIGESVQTDEDLERGN